MEADVVVYDALVAALARAAAYVGHDSGPTHLAAALGVPGVALFRSTSPRRWRPLSDRIVALDAIAAKLSYQRYLQAETTLRMRRVGGEKTAIFRDPPHVQAVVDDLTQAQTESAKRCF